MSRRRALVLFTRSPEAEARAKGFREAHAAPLFRAFLESWVRLSRETATDLVVASPASCRRRLEASGVAPGGRFLTQARAAFGERLAAAAGEAFGLGYDSVVLVGGDAPAIGAGDLRRAFEAIESGAVALGPAGDGGAYQIGVDARDADLGRSHRHRDRRALVRLLAAAADRRRGVVLLPARQEVDSALDAARARRLAGADPGWGPYRFLLDAALRPESPASLADLRPGSAHRPLRRAPRGPPAAA